MRWSRTLAARALIDLRLIIVQLTEGNVREIPSLPRNFEDWFAELRKLAAPFIERGEIAEDYLDPKSWRDYFEDGCTPAGGWADDVGFRKLKPGEPISSRANCSRFQLGGGSSG
jgi:hypothetical protein